MKKRILSLFMAVVFCCTLLPTALADEIDVQDAQTEASVDGTEYATLAEAINAIKSPEQTVVLLKDVTLPDDFSWPDDAAIQINMDYHSITFKDTLGQIITEQLTLTNGTLSGNVSVRGTLNLTAPASAEAAIKGSLSVYTGGTVNISGAKVGLDGSLSYEAVNTKETTNIVISGTEQAVKTTSAVSVPANYGVYGSANANDSASRTRADFAGGTYTVNGAAAKTLIVAPKPTITLTPADTTINAGQTAIFNATYDGTDALTASVENGEDNHITVSVDGTKITVATTTDTPNDNYTLTVRSSDDANITQTAAISVTEAPPVATVGGVNYSTLAGAIVAAEGAEITLVGTVTESITIPRGTTAHIDLNGRTWQNGSDAPDTLTVNGGEVILTNSDYTGSGSIESTAGNAVMVNSGKLKVDSPYVTLQGGTGCVALFVDSNCDVTLDVGTTLLGGLAADTTIAECLHMDGKALEKCDATDDTLDPANYAHLYQSSTSEDVTVIPDPGHYFGGGSSWPAGVCNFCGYACPHTNASADADSCPDCLNKFVARVTVGGVTSSHISIEAALAAADAASYAASSPATVTLLGNLTIRDSTAAFGFVFNYSDVTIDLGGYTLDYTSQDYALALNSADVTIKNGTIRNIGNSTDANAVQVRTGTLTLENVTFARIGSTSNGITVSGSASDAKLIVAADSGDSKCVFNGAVEIHGAAQLSGGVYNKGISYAGDYSALVADGYAFADKDGNVISYETVKERMNSTDESTDKTLTVVPHTHNGSPCECGFTCDHPTEKVGEDGKCTVCNHQYAFKTDAPYNGKYFFDKFSEAATSVSYGDTTTITLLKDASCDWSTYSSTKGFTLDLQKFTFTLSSNGLTCRYATITLRGDEGAEVTGELFLKAVILPADFKGSIDYIYPYSATVQSGSVGTLKIYPSDAVSGNIHLQGGSFNKIFIAEGPWAAGITVWGNLLIPGYRFQDTDTSQPLQYNAELSEKHNTITNVEVVPCNVHEYSNGYCVYCHSVCPHEKVTDGKCTVCGFQMPVSVTTNGETTYYADLDSALAAAQAGATVTLLDHAASGTVKADSPAFTLDLNGHNVNTLAVGAKITIKDSGATPGTIGSLSVTAEGVTLGDLTESGYAFKSTENASTWYTSETTAANVAVSPTPIKSIDYKDTAIVTYGNSCTLSVTVTPVNTGDTVTYQWYQVTSSTTAIEGAQDASYTIPNDLSAGGLPHVYRVAITVDGYTQTKDISVYVQRASIAGKTVTVSTPVYNGKEWTPTVEVEGLVKGLEYDFTCTPRKDAGTYDITIYGCSNYDGTIETTWQIAQAELLPSVSGTDKTYDGTDAATVNVTFEGLQSGEELTAGVDYTVSAHYSDADAGDNKTISCTIALNDTAKARNYRLLLTEFETKNAIRKAEQTITAADINAVYGDTDKAVHVSGAFGALTYTVNDSTVVTLGDDGALNILKSGDAVVTVRAAGDDNHNEAQTTVNVHVGKREISVKADDQSMTAGGALPDFTATYGNFAPGETADTVLDNRPLPTTTADGKTAGTFAITVEAPTLKPGMEDKYTVGAPVSGILTVSARSSGGGGGGGSSSSAPTYKPTVTPTDGGTTTVSTPNPKKGDTVTITPKPETGSEVAEVIVTDKNGKTVAVKANADGTYSFTQPDGAVTIKVIYQPKASDPAQTGFTDVSEGHFAYDAVRWAQDKDITGGVGGGKFAPDAACTRAQIVTFLWRAAGSPEPKGAAGFADVSAGSYYAKAVAWAIENGITAGTGNGLFAPDDACTRAQSVTFLWRALGSAAGHQADFDDVPAGSYYESAVAWAAANSVTTGIGGGLFAPDSGCTRAQIVTFLYRVYAD